ncbi:MAG: monovalent cation/H+ antiporter subunit D family protein [Xanthomonadales bacterium]|nr:monovalent cation/H+ antiporter subunit D family protein [Xanthomonadales bacterium]
MSHWQVLIVVIPLLAAPLATLLRGRVAPWLLATAVSWTVLAVALYLITKVYSYGTLSYALGGWAAPIGIEYRLDAANALVQLLIALVAAVVMPYALVSARRDIDNDRQPGFYAAMLLLLAGLLGITATGDAFNVFVFLEISSLSTYTLIALGRDRKALTSAFRYLIMGTVGATFFLIGVGLLYAMTGTLNMADLAQRLPEVSDTRTMHTAVAFLVVGVCLKLALFPLHLWLPNAYTYAPSTVTALVAATSTKVAVYVLIRFLYTIFGIDFSFGKLPLSQILLALAVIGMLVASAVAINQPNAKRLLAYSSVAQVGYMVLGLALASSLGVTAALLHMFNHALMKGALFLALGCIAYRVGNNDVDRMRGLGKAMPWTMAAFVIGGLSLIGVPLTVGFISKWYLVLAALEQGWWWLVVVILVSSLLAVIYIWRIVEVAYFQPSESRDVQREAPLGLLLPTWALVLMNLWFGVDTRLSVGLAEQAALALTGIGP